MRLKTNILLSDLLLSSIAAAQNRPTTKLPATGPLFAGHVRSGLGGCSLANLV